MKEKILILILLITAISIALLLKNTAGANSKSGLQYRSINIDGDKREYYVYLPASYSANKPAPVILSFHGGGGNATAQTAFTSMNKTADKYGFIVVYPEGTPSALFEKMRTWNSGNCCGRAQRINTDDVKFVRAIIKDIKSAYSINSKRIYATGMSNGAMISYRMACELSDLIAAIAPVSGTMNLISCKPLRPVSVMHFHGTEDNHCPYKGGVGKKSIARQFFSSVDSTISQWKKINSCPAKGKIILKKGNVTCTSYSPCKQNSEVVLCKIEGGGHTWPGGKNTRLLNLGPVNNDINANEEMWKFFSRYSL